MSTEYNTPTRIIIPTDTNYNTIPIFNTSLFFARKVTSLKYQFLKLCASEFPSEEKHEASEGEGDLALGWPLALAPWWPR